MRSRHSIRRHAGFLPLLLVAVCLSLLAGPAQAWWNKDWPDRKQIGLDPATGGVAGAENLTQVPVLIRLHSGNFAYFLDTKADGSDLRFVAGDDKTPLKFHIEQYEQVAGLAAIWVQVPTLPAGGAAGHIWMYYGNPNAPAAFDTAGTYDVATVAAYHYAERTGLPRDSSAFQGHPAEGSVKLGQPGVIDLAAEFDPSATLRVPANAALTAPAGKGFTLSTWLKLTKAQDRGTVFTLGPKKAGLHLELVQNNLEAHLTAAGKPLVVRTTAPLTVDRWYHVAVTIGAKLRLYLDGEAVAEAEINKPADVAGDLVLGATAEDKGFSGLLDETQIATVERPANWIRVAGKGQGPDGKLVVYGEDESAEASSGFSYLALLKTLALAISADGWVIIAVTVVLGLIAFDVMTNKFFLVRRVERQDDRFLADSGLVNSLLREEDAAAKRTAMEKLGGTYRQSTLFRLFQTGVAETDRLFELMAARGAGRTLPAEGLEVIRSGLDATIVEENNRLNARMVLVTIAISGAPFLGLLGTVVGVMMTFAAVAATGDVNVNTIAPGVASAMSTTVVGLFIAIPCMFGYNYLATLIAKRMSVMEVYADRLLSTFALIHSASYGTMEDRDATPEPTQTLR